MRKTLFLVFIALLVAACSSKLSGTYVGQGMFAASSLTFKDDGKVVIDNMGIKAEAPYEISGDQLKISIMGGIVTTLNKDGSFELPGGAKYIKK